MDLDDIRLKDPSDLSDDEKKFLRDNKDELTEQEWDDYSDVLADKKEEEKPDNEEEEEKKPEKQEEEKKTYTEAELKKMMDDSYAERRKKEKEQEEAQKIAKEQEEEDKKLKKGKFFNKDYKPKDWNQFAKDFLGIIRKDRDKTSREQRQTIAMIEKRLDDETEDLRSVDSTIPAKGTPERNQFDRDIAEVMLQNPKIRSVAKAYGVLKVQKEKKEESKKKKKDIASKVGGNTGESTTQKGDTKYEKFASRTMDDAEEAALKKWKELS